MKLLCNDKLSLTIANLSEQKKTLLFVLKHVMKSKLFILM